MRYKLLSFSTDDTEKLALFKELRRRLWQEDSAESIPDGARLFLVMENGVPISRAAALTNPLMRFREETPGLLGYFESENTPAATELLFAAVEEYHRAHGRNFLIGPLNGSTWQSYRVTLPSAAAPFFLDNRSLPHYQALFEKHGFTAIANYITTRTELSETEFTRLERSRAYFAKRGIFVRNFRMAEAEAELRRIHALSLKSFRNNFLYTPIEFEPFYAQYQRLMPLLKEDDILLAEDSDGELVGFLFAFENRNAPRAGEMVIKTLAAAPAPHCRGVGTFLVELFQKQAHDAGFRAAFHALMHEENISAKIGKHAEVYERYALYGKSLTEAVYGE